MNAIETLRGAIARTEEEAGIETHSWVEAPRARVDLLLLGILIGAGSVGALIVAGVLPC